MAAGATDSASNPGEGWPSEQQTPPPEDGLEDFHRQGDTLSTELWCDVPLCVPLPIEILSAQTKFPFLDATLVNLGITIEQVRERVLWADCRRTTVQSSAGVTKDKSVMLLEVRVKALRPDSPHIREVLYTTETHSDCPFGRCSLAVLPWINAPESQSVEVTLSVDIEIQPEIELLEEVVVAEIEEEEEEEAEEATVEVEEEVEEATVEVEEEVEEVTEEAEEVEVMEEAEEEVEQQQKQEKEDKEA